MASPGFAPVFRTVLPLAAGSARMPVSRFLRSAALPRSSGEPAPRFWAYAAVKSFSGGSFLTHSSGVVAAVAIAGLFLFAHRYLSRDEEKSSRKKPRKN